MTSSLPILVLGSNLEAHLVLEGLLGLNADTEVHYLAEERSGNGPLPRVRAQGDGIEKAVLKDVWGKTVLSVSLPGLALFQENRPTHHNLTVLPAGLTLSRVSTADEGFQATFSDGTELLCRLVLFCDGVNSRAKSFWTKPVEKRSDSDSIRCWGFRTKNYAAVKDWEFRWAPAKSMEVIPEGEDLWVNLRFKSPFGTKLSVAELKALFSEFGSDIEAFFESLTDEDIRFAEEEKLSHADFHPAPGCLAFGAAAWPSREVLPFDWLERLVRGQVRILKEQLEVGQPNFESFEAQSKDLLQEIEVADSFMRRHLNSDNAFVRPLRNLLLAVLPNSLLAGQLKKKLLLD